MLALFICQIAFKPFLLLSELSDFELSFLIEPDEFHVQIADFVFFLFTVFLEFSDFEFVFFVIVQMISFYGLDLHMVLVFELRYLHVLDVLNVSDLLFQFFNLVEKATIFQIT